MSTGQRPASYMLSKMTRIFSMRTYQKERVARKSTKLFYSFVLFLATLSFWYVRMENILVIFESMYEAGRWPVDIYPGWLRAILTFVVPVAFAVTVPAEALTARLTWLVLAGTLLLAALALLASRLFWRFAIRYYSGASA